MNRTDQSDPADRSDRLDQPNPAGGAQSPSRAIRASALALAALAFVLLAGCASGPKQAPPSSVNEPMFRFSFDDLKPGTFPAGWKSDTLDPENPTAVWSIAKDSGALSRKNVFRAKPPERPPRNAFNLCWTDEVRFRNGRITVSARADEGEIDQGGGVVWRVKDARNYYLARYNPLEHNFRLYTVIEGKRQTLATSEKLFPEKEEWFSILIVHQDGRIEGWLNGQLLIETTNADLPDEGGVGLWTKADAATSFDDFIIAPRPVGGAAKTPGSSDASSSSPPSSDATGMFNSTGSLNTSGSPGKTGVSSPKNP